jgi:signal transduction histidine kinase
MALYYASVLASQSELETEVRGHLATATALRAATEEAERASTAKAEFLARMSHELRTPLNAVIGYSQILLEDARDEGDTASMQDLRKIHDAGQQLLKLVNEILDLSKIEAGKMDLHIEEVDAAALISEALDDEQPNLQSSNNALQVKLHPNLGSVAWDVAKFRTLFIHIYENAHKFTRNGEVVVEAWREPLGGTIAIDVRDTGIGISQNQIEHLFEKFEVADDSSSSKYGGTGLGLALSQRLCQLMGGKILVESQVGVGSSFKIRLPARAGAPAAGRPHIDPYTEATLVPVEACDTPVRSSAGEPVQ